MDRHVSHVYHVPRPEAMVYFRGKPVYNDLILIYLLHLPFPDLLTGFIKMIASSHAMAACRIDIYIQSQTFAVGLSSEDPHVSPGKGYHKFLLDRRYAASFS